MTVMRLCREFIYDTMEVALAKIFNHVFNDFAWTAVEYGDVGPGSSIQ